MKEKLKRADAWNKFCISRVCERVLNDASCFLFCFILWLQASPTQNFSVVFWVEPDMLQRNLALMFTCSQDMIISFKIIQGFLQTLWRLTKRQIKNIFPSTWHFNSAMKMSGLESLPASPSGRRGENFALPRSNALKIRTFVPRVTS